MSEEPLSPPPLSSSEANRPSKLTYRLLIISSFIDASSYPFHSFLPPMDIFSWMRSLLPFFFFLFLVLSQNHQLNICLLLHTLLSLSPFPFTPFLFCLCLPRRPSWWPLDRLLGDPSFSATTPPFTAFPSTSYSPHNTLLLPPPPTTTLKELPSDSISSLLPRPQPLLSLSVCLASSRNFSSTPSHFRSVARRPAPLRLPSSRRRSDVPPSCLPCHRRFSRGRRSHLSPSRPAHAS